MSYKKLSHFIFFIVNLSQSKCHSAETALKPFCLFLTWKTENAIVHIAFFYKHWELPAQGSEKRARNSHREWNFIVLIKKDKKFNQTFFQSWFSMRLATDVWTHMEKKRGLLPDLLIINWINLYVVNFCRKLWRRRRGLSLKKFSAEGTLTDW